MDCATLAFLKEKKKNLMKILFLGFCVALHALGYITSTTTTTTTTTTIVSPTTTLCGCLFYFRLQITFLIYTN